MEQVTEVLLWRVIVFSLDAVVVQMFPPSEVAQGGGAGACGTAVLNMAASCLSSVIFFLSKVRDGSGRCRVL